MISGVIRKKRKKTLCNVLCTPLRLVQQTCIHFSSRTSITTDGISSCSRNLNIRDCSRDSQFRWQVYGMPIARRLHCRRVEGTPYQLRYLLSASPSLISRAVDMATHNALHKLLTITVHRQLFTSAIAAAAALECHVLDFLTPFLLLLPNRMHASRVCTP